MVCPVCKKDGNNSRLQRTLDTGGNEILLCPLCGYKKIIRSKAEASKDWSTEKPADVPALPQKSKKATKGSPPFTKTELKQGYRKL